MKPIVCLLLLFCCLILPRRACGQDEYSGVLEEDYDDSFGDDHESAHDDTGSRSLSEAAQTGRGYRIGAGGDYRIPEVHAVEKGDTLWDITEHYYGDPWQWPQVWSYNPEITNPHWIYPLDQIRLRMDDGAREPEPKSEIGRSVSERSAEGSVILQSYGYLDEEALRTVGRIFGADEEHMMLSKSDVVYIKFKPGQSVQTGKPYTVFRKMRQAEREKEERGTLVRIFGTVVIDDYDSKKLVARGVIDESLDPIERGYQIAVLDTQFTVVPPKTNERWVVATIIANLRPRRLIGSYNVVFIDAGIDKGVMPGNRFIVFRKGDEWQKSLFTSVEEMGGVYELPEYRQAEYPREKIGVLRVIKVRKKTSVALITSANTDIKIGDRVEMPKGF
ncbi:MAG: LysM peptidoglycan-binding domain-containing protein [Deltaproteobacteria bacterium]|nr:LysM peptidoglycan-binding domain-containing protein [Deltaproteobacteria bacterium]